MAKSSIINVLINGDTRGLTSALNDADGKIGKLVTDASKKFVLFASAVGVAGIAIGKQFVDAASDLNEVMAKTDVIFGNAAEMVKGYAGEFATAFGQSKKATLEAASTFGTFGKAAGLTGNELAGFSVGLAALASDLASFSNTSPEQAAEALGAALRGESEPIRSYGVLLDDATLKAKAFEMGLYDGKGALTQQAKILAAQAAIYEQTGDAQGDFARTSGGLANQQRILAARFENLKASLGQALLPIALKIATAFGRLIDKVGPLAERYMPVLVEAFNKAAAKATEIGRAVADYLTPHIERIGKWMVDNTHIVKTFFAVLAGAAAIAAIVAIGAAIASLMNPVGLVVVAIAGLVAGFQYAYENFEGFRNAVDATIQFVRQVIEGFITVVQAAWAAWGDEIKTVGIAAWEFIKAVVDRIVTGVRTAIEQFTAAVKYIWNRWGEDIKNVVSLAWDFIKGYVEVALGVVRGAIQTVTALIKGDWSGAWQAIKDTVSGAIEGLIELIRNIGPRVAAIARSAFDGLKDAFRSAINFIIRGWNSLEFKVPGFKIGPVGYDGFTLGLPDIPQLAAGGIVTRPTLAVVGEAGPEAVIPLNRAGGMGMGAVTVNIFPRALPTDRELIDLVNNVRRRNGDVI